MNWVKQLNIEGHQIEVSSLIQLDKPGSMDTICERCEDSDEDFEPKIDNSRYMMNGPPPGMSQHPHT